MAKVIKKLIPTSKVESSSKVYTISSTGTISVNGINTPLSLIFDSSNVTNAENANLVISLSEASFAKMTSMTGNVSLYLRIDSSIYEHKYKTFTTGPQTFTADVAPINGRDSFGVDIDGWVASYSGSNPDMTMQLGTLMQTLDMDGCYIEYLCREPEVADFTVSGASIDDTISCSWSQTDVASWTVTVKKNNIVKATITGTTDSGCSFPVGTFNEAGDYVFEIIAINGTSVTASTTVTLTGTQASISLLELPSKYINIDEAFTITWVSTNQSRFELTVGTNKYTGTTQNSVTIPKCTANKGTNSVTLTVFFENAYYSNYAQATNSFVGYGKPVTPTLTLKGVYSSATPSLTWNSTDQVAYNVVLKQGITTIIDTEEVISANTYYVPSTALEDDLTYTMSVRVKNKYNLWSDFATSDFLVQFNAPVAPTIQAVSDITTGSIIISVNTDDDDEYKNTEIWKKEPGGTWKRMAYKLNASDTWQDFYVAGGINYEYKARNIGKSGGISDSDIITISTIVKGYNLYNVEDNTQYISFKCGEPPKPKINQNIVKNMFANAPAPTLFTDGVMYWSCILNFTLDSREDIFTIYKLIRAKLLLYKDNKGHKWFGNIVNSPEFSEDDVEIIKVQLEFTQSQFTEQDLYNGGNLELISWNGGWKFDGTHTFGGE